MGDIIEQCALAMCSRLCPADMSACGECKSEARAVLTTFKQLTAEPTPRMVEAGKGFDDDGYADQAADFHWKAMQAKMFEDIGI